MNKCKWCGSDDGCDCQDRIVCTKAGQWGHRTCGWCHTHSQPRFLCDFNECGLNLFMSAPQDTHDDTL